ncbi:MAG: hypothetical protein EP330_23520 [Deltaproteobacteria bacterium]|nr:MAG: hypothetical protein EP330_23520 [Deltaproteobacteria bacterium]
MSASCPACVPRSTSWSGADIDFVREAIPGGTREWFAEDGNYPSVDLVRCASCGQLWMAEHHYPDRPPYACWLKQVDEADADLAKAGGLDAFFALVAKQGSMPELRGLVLGVALNATADTRLAIRQHPDFPERIADYWDRLVSWGTL